jgi:hypothetical protein
MSAMNGDHAHFIFFKKELRSLLQSEATVDVDGDVEDM